MPIKNIIHKFLPGYDVNIVTHKYIAVIKDHTRIDVIIILVVVLPQTDVSTKITMLVIGIAIIKDNQA